MYMQMQVAAKELGMSRQWLYQLITRGEIATSTVAGRRVVKNDARFKALKRKRNGAAQ